MVREGLATISLPCPRCGRKVRSGPGEAPAALACARCGEEVRLARPGRMAGEAPSSCRVCGSPFLYWQKDFSQKLGCTLVAIGAVLTPWTYGLSLALLALVDLVLYRLLPRLSVCYVCRARYRGVPPHPGHAPFDLITAQTYEARAKNWADGRLRPAFSEEEGGAAAAAAPPG